MWKNIWFESNWKWHNFKRPVLILKRIWTMFLIVSMTTKWIWKENKFYYKLNNKYFNKISFITLSQFKTIDKKRFIDKIWKINEEDFLEIKNKIKKLF
jgi:mRNA-degrading endonuclease toxin of MazEF toxin-antitoxin module